MWSLIPWRTLLKLALPFIREFFIGQFNSKSYFAKHPVIFVCLLTISILSLTLVFITEQAIYHANRSYDLDRRVLQLEGQLKEKPKKDIHSEVVCRPTTEQGSAKEVVLVPTTPKPIPVHTVETRIVEKTIPVYTERIINTQTIVKASEPYDSENLNKTIKQINEEE